MGNGHEPDDFADALDNVVDAFLGEDLDEYGMTFIRDQLKRAGATEEQIENMDGKDIINKLIDLPYTPAQRAWVMNANEKLDDENYREHMMSKDD